MGIGGLMMDNVNKLVVSGSVVSRLVVHHEN